MDEKRPINDHPILFSASMVRAILEGRKTQTRRVMKPQPTEVFSPIAVEWYAPIVVDRNGDEQPGAEIFGVYDDEEGYRCPYGAPGARLWVKETHYLWGKWRKNGLTKSGKQKWRFFSDRSKGAKYADNQPEHICKGKGQTGWYRRPSIFMPRWASRITLEIVNVRVERVQEIEKEENVNDVFEEGLPKHAYYEFADDELCDLDVASAVEDYKELWNSINAKRGYGWEINPWVWVIEFKILEAKNETC